MPISPDNVSDRVAALRRLRVRLLLGLSLAVLLGLVGTAMYYVRQAENAILAENDRALHKITDAVALSLESIMVGGHAEVAAEFSRRLSAVGGARRFMILRVDGTPAFKDNRTIEDVNRRLGAMVYTTHAAQEFPGPVPETDSEAFREAASGTEARKLEVVGAGGEHLTVMIDPIFSGTSCRRCHGEREKVRGLVLLESSSDAVERDLLEARQRALMGLAIALAGTMLATGYLLGRMLFGPIEHVTRAMRRVSAGDWDHGVPVESEDEIGQMANNFNLMRDRLKDNYLSLLAEQDKLTTILLTSREAVIVTDREGRVVLVNPAAEEILGKSSGAIRQDGFEQIVEDPDLVRSLLCGEQACAEKLFHGRMLSVSAATIRDGSGAPIGSAALIRDIDEEYRLRDRLTRMARVDELTGLYNRRHLDERFEQEFERMREDGRPLAVLIFDIDHFKRFNDSHGHEAGDRVLRAVGQATRHTLRCYDVLGRYGGEEFVAVLPGLHSGDAGPVADRLRSDVAALDVNGLHVSISIGVACTESVAADSPVELLAASDAALYQAKREGRNRVVLAAATA